MTTLTLPTGVHDTVNLHPGVTNLEISASYSDDVTVNLAAHSEWIGGWSGAPYDNFNIRGQGVWDNDGVTFAPGNTTVGVDVVGTGTIRAYQSHQLGGKMTFLHGVSVPYSQTVIDDGYQLYGSEYGNVEVQSPSLYHAYTQLGFGQLELDGLHATSYEVGFDTLTLFNGNKVVFDQRFSKIGNEPLVVSQTSAGVNIHADDFRYTLGGATLPQHT